MTDTDSTSLLFLFICKKESSIPEDKARSIIFDVFTQSKLKDRLDLSSDFWQTYNVQNKSLKKQVGLYKFENIEKPILITIAIDLKTATVYKQVGLTHTPPPPLPQASARSVLQRRSK